MGSSGGARASGDSGRVENSSTKSRPKSGLAGGLTTSPDQQDVIEAKEPQPRTRSRDPHSEAEGHGQKVGARRTASKDKAHRGPSKEKAHAPKAEHSSGGE